MLLRIHFSGNTYSLKTPDNAAYNYRWLSFKSSKKFLTFEVCACHTARLRLAQLAFGSVQYEIILGAEANGKSQILSYSDAGTSVIAEEDTPDILDCSEIRRFTLSWINDKIQLLAGSMSGRVIIDWRKDQGGFALFAAALSTGPGSQGDWKFSFNEGEKNRL